MKPGGGGAIGGHVVTCCARRRPLGVLVSKTNKMAAHIRWAFFQVLKTKNTARLRFGRIFLCPVVLQTACTAIVISYNIYVSPKLLIPLLCRRLATSRTAFSYVALYDSLYWSLPVTCNYVWVYVDMV